MGKETSSVTGFIQCVDTSVKAIDRNPFYDVIVMTSPEVLRVVRVCKNASKVNTKVFIEKQKLKTAISIDNLTVAEDKRVHANNSPTNTAPLLLMTSSSEVTDTPSFKMPIGQDIVPSIGEILMQRKPLDLSQRYTACGRLTWKGKKALHRFKKEKREYLREAVLTDATGSIQVGVWGDVIEQLENKKLYRLTNVRLSNAESCLNPNEPVISTTQESGPFLIQIKAQ